MLFEPKFELSDKKMESLVTLLLNTIRGIKNGINHKKEDIIKAIIELDEKYSLRDINIGNIKSYIITEGDEYKTLFVNIRIVDSIYLDITIDVKTKEISSTVLHSVNLGSITINENTKIQYGLYKTDKIDGFYIKSIKTEKENSSTKIRIEKGGTVKEKTNNLFCMRISYFPDLIYNLNNILFSLKKLPKELEIYNTHHNVLLNN